ncbi:MAG: metallophosphoesterase [Thermoplasmatota archaeon]
MSEVVDRILTEGIESIQESEYRKLVRDAVADLEKENLVERDWNNFVVVGDCHGELNTARTAAEYTIERGIPIIFLGDYVDRGDEQLETLAYVLGLKLDRIDKTLLLRGNHETEAMNRRYGFYQVIESHYSLSLYDEIVRLYHKLPVSAVVNGFFLAHGGIPEGIKDVGEINQLDRNSEQYREIFWNDPDDGIMDFDDNLFRGGYKLYGKRAVNDFLKRNELEKIIRAHQVFKKGYKYFFDKKLLSIFSVPEYRGGNKGIFAHIKDGNIVLKEI